MSSCGVCTAPLSALGGDLAACPSGDVFHSSCIHKWIASRGQCCTCKQRCTQQQLVTLKLPHADTAAVTQHRKPTTASTPTTPLSSHAQVTLAAALSSPPSPTLPPKGSPLSLAHVEELIASYRHTASSYQQNRQLLQHKLTTKLHQLQLAYSRVVSQPIAGLYEAGADDADDALLHRHMLMAKLLAAVHEGRLRDEEDSVEEMARVVRRVTGGTAADDEAASVAEVVRDMEQLMDEVDEECWARIRTKRQQLSEMEEEMTRDQHEKQQRTQRIVALDQRRQELEDSMHATTNTRKRKHTGAAAAVSNTTPFAERMSAAVRSHMESNQPTHMSPAELMISGSGGSEDDEDSREHTSPPLSATSSTSKRRKGLSSLPLTPPPQLTSDQFDALSDNDKLTLPRITILTHCPTIESFLSHQLHLRTLKRRWPDNEWRKINTTYTGQRKRKGLKGRGRGRQVLPATVEEQQVWRDVRKREIALLMGVVVEGEMEGGEGDGSVGGSGSMGGGEAGSGSVDEDDEDDEQSEDDGNESNGGSEGKERSENSERSEMSEAQPQPVVNGHVKVEEHVSAMHA